MVPFGGPGVMVLAVMVTGFVLLLAALVSRRRIGWDKAISVALFLWALTALFIITLVPANGPPGIIPADLAQTTCSFDYGGPAPEGFWIFGGGQRLLNVAVFVPAGIMLTVALSRFRHGLWLVVPAVLVLIGCSVLIETIQLELTRINRACDVTDVVDNATGAVLGTALGLLVVGVVRVGPGARSRRAASRRI